MNKKFLKDLSNFYSTSEDFIKVQTRYIKELEKEVIRLNIKINSKK